MTMTQEQENEFNKNLQAMIDDPSFFILERPKNTDKCSFYTFNFDKFIDEYNTLFANYYENDEYKNQRAITAYHAINDIYTTEDYKNLCEEGESLEEIFRTAFEERLKYDFEHLSPLKPTRLQAALENITATLYHNPITTYGTLSLITTAAAAIAAVSLVGALVVGFGTFFSPAFFIAAGAAVISLGIMRLASALTHSEYNVYRQFKTTIEDTNELTDKYTSITHEHETAARNDRTLRPWHRDMFFVVPTTDEDEVQDNDSDFDAESLDV